MLEIGAAHLPATLMYARCNDRQNPALDGGRVIEGSAVYSVLRRRYTPADLRAINLLERLDAKIEATPGGCRYYLTGGT